MKPDIVNALEALKPEAVWSLVNNPTATSDYECLVWQDETQTKPTEQEIEVKLAELQYQEEVNVYQEKRKLEYPDWGDQLDKIYHSGINAWKADIKTIKDKYPKQTMDATELQKRKDAALFKVQKKNYEKAVARLAQYELSVGVKLDHPNVLDINTQILYAIEPLPIEIDGKRNPLVVKDEEERAAAYEVINNTPQAVIDSVSS